VKNQRDLWFCRGFAVCLLFALGLVAWLVVVEPVAAATTTFAHTGAAQTYTVPAGQAGAFLTNLANH
jgi:hypothetical protein